MGQKNYVITAAQHNAPVYRNFLKSLETYAEANNAELVVLTMRERKDDDGLVSLVQQHKVLDDNFILRLNRKIHASNYHIRPQQIDPVTGLARFTQQDVSTIFASPKQRLKVIPNSMDSLPKTLLTTGAVTTPSYRDGFRISEIAKRDHVYGAVFVQVMTNQRYHYRHLTANSRGDFSDMGWRYSGTKDPQPASLEALVMGDLHVGDHDPRVVNATYEMFDAFKPKRVILHDLFNGHSVNHHTSGQLLEEAKLYSLGRKNLADEFEQTATLLEEIVNASQGAEVVVVACNHHDFLEKYINNGMFTKEPYNLMFVSRILPKVLSGEDPVKAGISEFYKIPDNVRFLSRNEDYKVLGWQLGVHGDKGPNGAWKASTRALEDAYGKSITGHKHTPEILRNTVVVGTSTYLNLDYLRGPSSWMNTHGFLYDTGRAQLVNIINGRWRD